MRKFSAPARVVIDSPLVLYNRELSQDGDMEDMEMSLKSSRAKRSLNDEVEKLLESEKVVEANEVEAEKELDEVAEDAPQEVDGSPLVVTQHKQQTLQKSTRLQMTNEDEFQETPQESNVNEMNTQKKTRGRTTLASLTKRNDDLIKIKWNEKGQPIGPNYVQFSSFVGALVRKIVPYNI